MVGGINAGANYTTYLNAAMALGANEQTVHCIPSLKWWHQLNSVYLDNWQWPSCCRSRRFSHWTSRLWYHWVRSRRLHNHRFRCNESYDKHWIRSFCCGGDCRCHGLNCQKNHGRPEDGVLEWKYMLHLISTCADVRVDPTTWFSLSSPFLPM